MVQCVVIGCRSRSDVHTSPDNEFTLHTSYYRLPKDLINNEQMKAIFKTKSITRSTRICSKHFTEKNFYYTSTDKKRLKPDAIPDINIKLSANNSKDSLPVQKLKRKIRPQANLTTDENMLNESSNQQKEESSSQVYTQMEMKTEPNDLSHIPVAPQSWKGQTAREKELQVEVKKLKLLCNKRLNVIKSLRLQNTQLLQQIASLKQALK